MKRIIPLLISILLLASCSAPQAELLDFIGSSDFAGYNGLVVDIAQPTPTETHILSYEDNNSIQSDALAKRIRDIENNLDVEIELTSNTSDAWPEVSSIVSNNYDVEIIYRDSGSSAWSLAQAGVLYPINEFPEYIDLSDTDKFGTPGVLESVMFDGIPYAVQPTYWPGFQGIECFLVAYNMDTVSLLGLTDLHEYYENETWTWDTFKSVLDSAESIIGENEYLFTGHSGRLLNTFLLANGYNFVDINNGELSFNFYSSQVQTALEFYQKILNDYGEKVRISTDRWDTTEFIAGLSLTAIVTGKDVTTGSVAYESDFNYGIMPFPSGPDSNYGEWAQTVTRVSGFSIPITVTDPEPIAHVISELCEPFEEFGGSRESLMEYYADSVFINPIDAEIYFAVDRNVRFDYDDFGLISVFESMSSNLKTKSVNEVIQTYEPQVRDIYENDMKPNLEGYMIEALGIE